MKIKEKIIGSVTILVLSVVFLSFGYFSNKADNESYEEVFTNNDTGKASQAITEAVTIKEGEEQGVKSTIVVDIKGAVKNPKEYELKDGARIRDLIDVSGGLTEDADKDRIYFSKVLKDEQCIKIYRIGEDEEELGDMITNDTEGSSGAINSNGKININKATLEELQTLSGIGEVKAQSILEYREANGKFNTIDELANITGIGAKTVEKLRDKVDIK
ncbi:helix-hairpin-helix domain-containing protein [Clostridium sp.]|uniref:helix-hairpin-helix domain-containing protein n=1 Tax=Clostridium sp. TaxID=1506 RepID=UPI0032164F3A